MNRRESLIALNMIPEIGSRRMESLRQAFGSLEEVFRASSPALEGVSGIGAGIAQRIRGFDADLVQRELARAQELGIAVLTCDDPGYPPQLRDIPGWPLVLYVRGNVAALSDLAVAVVGSRHASWYGIRSARDFSRELAASGVAVVSGLARGVDTWAHRGALEARGTTVAVLGCGLDRIYPRENLGLSGEIAEHGALVSEFPFGAPPLKQHFPRRNRVISGLSKGVLVVEAGRTSGALITADFALEQGREVFALPGQVGLECAAGSNELLKQGATLVTCAQEVLEALQLPEAHARAVPAPAEGILGYCTDSPITVDELFEKTGTPVPELYASLVRLQLQRLVVALPGSQFVRSMYE
jgi:DNA processing protein